MSSETFLPPDPNQRLEMPPSHDKKYSPAVFGLAVAAYLAAYVFFAFSVADPWFQGIGTTIFFFLLLATCLVYIRINKIKQNLLAWLFFAAAVAGAVGFTLNGTMDIGFLLFLGESCLCALWLAYTCRTLLARPLSVLLSFDWVNQIFVLPFANFGAFFTKPLQGQKGKSPLKVLGITVLSLMISLPLIFLVLLLLASSSTPFSSFLGGFLKYLENLEIARYVLYLILAIPLGAWLFGLIYGNVQKRHTEHISRNGLLNVFETCHALPKVALLTPLILLILIYLAYCITFASYLFSGMNNNLPLDYTYADYARQGFFELAAVSCINLFCLGVLWLASKRNPKNYPLSLRIISLALCLMTCLLIAVAASKLLLYIGVFGLTPLRLYVGLFLILLAVVFLSLIVWSFYSFNAGYPALAAIIAVFLVVSLGNTNAWIADYNVNRYLEGEQKTVDVSALEGLGPAAAPALERLYSKSPDDEVAEDARQQLSYLQDEQRMVGSNPWYSFDLNDTKVHVAYLKSTDKRD